MVGAGLPVGTLQHWCSCQFLSTGPRVAFQILRCLGPMEWRGLPGYMMFVARLSTAE